MKKLLVLLMVVAVSGMAVAAQTVDFDSVALRPANDDASNYGTITEYANGNGVTVQTLEAGQKVYYGTDYFNGWALNTIDYLEFTYEKSGTTGNNPYSNLVIHDGSGNYGIISSQGGYTLSETTVDNVTTKTMRYYFAGDSGNQAFGFRFYEPSPDAGSWGHGTNLAWSDISDWSLLGVGVSRPLHSGELSSPRGPVEHGIAIMWGDSLSNYIGDREIYDVVVNANGLDYVAGTPVPVPGAFLLGGLGVACVGWIKRRKSL